MSPRKKAAAAGPVPVEDLRHDDTRANIPTGELAAFGSVGTDAPVRYPRDPSLDPQLVWKGKDEQDERALRAEVDEDAWASLYRTRSRPFSVPGSGKMAVKVVDHDGDEVLQVYEV